MMTGRRCILQSISLVGRAESGSGITSARSFRFLDDNYPELKQVVMGLRVQRLTHRWRLSAWAFGRSLPCARRGRRDDQPRSCAHLVTFISSWDEINLTA